MRERDTVGGESEGGKDRAKKGERKSKVEIVGRERGRE